MDNYRRIYVKINVSVLMKMMMIIKEIIINKSSRCKAWL